jgi:hypothetical protein
MQEEDSEDNEELNDPMAVGMKSVRSQIEQLEAGSDIAVDYAEESHYSAMNDVNSFATIFEREKDQADFNQALELINLHALIIFRTVMKYNEPS